MNKNKKIIFFILILILFLGLLASLKLSGEKQEIRKKAAGTGVILSINPSTVTVLPNETFTVGVTVDTGDETISAAELHLSYDASKLEAQSITAGSYLPKVLTSGQADGGTASITVGSQPTEPKKGSGILATISFKTLTPSISNIDFASSTQVAVIGKTGNVLQSSQGAQVTVNPPLTETPAPTATPIPPTVTPLSTNTPIPTETPMPSATPIPTSTPTLPPPTPTDIAGGCTDDSQCLETQMCGSNKSCIGVSCLTVLLPCKFYVVANHRCELRDKPDRSACASEDGLVGSCRDGVCVVPTITTNHTPVPPPVTATPGSCVRKVDGDANCDGKGDGIDYSIWLNSQCNPGAGQTCSNLQADFNGDGKVNDDDFKIWFNNRAL